MSEMTSLQGGGGAAAESKDAGDDDEVTEFEENQKEDFGCFNRCCATGMPCQACGQCCKRVGYAIGCACCCCEDDTSKTFDSVQKNRSPTDMPWCIAMVIATIVQFVLFIVAITGGADAARLIHGADINGTVCRPGAGKGGNAMWPDIRMYHIMLCTHDCNATLFDDRVVTPAFDTDLESAVREDGVEGYRSESFFHYCLPDPNGTSEFVSVALKEDYEKFERAQNTIGEALDRSISDFEVAWPICLVSFFTAVLLSFSYAHALRKVAGIIVWVSIALCIIGMTILSIFLIDFSSEAYDYGYDTIGDFMYYGGWILACIDAAFVLAILFMMQRIRLAIAFSKETTLALEAAPNLIFWPMIPVGFLLFYFAYWVVSTLFMTSVSRKEETDWPDGVYNDYYDGGPTLNETLCIDSCGTVWNKYETVDDWKAAVAFSFFMLLWTMSYLGYFTYCVIAGVYAEWFFAEWEDSSEKKKKRGRGATDFSPTPVIDWAKRISQYHCGSIAFGSFLIAVVMYAEACLTYIEKKVLDGDPTKAQQIILAILRCLLKCLKCLIDRINEHGFIIVALYGWPLCPSSQKGIALIFKNVVRATALDMVSGYLRMVGMVTVIIFNCGFMIMLARLIYGDQLSSLLMILVLVACISFAVSWQFMEVFDVGITTVFICFLIDEERNRGGYMRASSRLRKLIGETKVKKRDVQAKTRGHRGEYVSKKQRRFWGGSDEVEVDTAEGATK